MTSEHAGKECIFCSFVNTLPRENMVHDSELFIAVKDKFPVNKGHTLIIPRRHVEAFFDLTREEFSVLKPMMDAVKVELDEENRPDGYNIGINVGQHAGQTVFHVHIHVIPRYKGDVEHAAGGIRKFKQPLVEYE